MHRRKDHAETIDICLSVLSVPSVVGDQLGFLSSSYFQELAAEIFELQRRKEDLESELKKVSTIFVWQEVGEWLW